MTSTRLLWSGQVGLLDSVLSCILDLTQSRVLSPHFYPLVSCSSCEIQLPHHFLPNISPNPPTKISFLPFLFSWLFLLLSFITLMYLKTDLSFFFFNLGVYYDLL
jgi:hypothetical protein